MSRREQIDPRAGGAVLGSQDADSVRRAEAAGFLEGQELQERQQEVQRAAAERRAAQSALAEEEARAQERLRQLNERIESLLSGNSQEFVIRFLQTEGQ